MLWLDVWVALGGDDGDWWQPCTQLVTVIVDVVKVVSMDPPPCVRVTGQVVTVVYVVRVSVAFGDADGAPVGAEDDSDLLDKEDSELVDDEDSERVEELPVPIMGIDVVDVVDVAAPVVEMYVEFRLDEAFCVATAEPAKTAAKKNNEACMLEIVK